MKNFRLNYELSEEVYNRNKDSIKINECYRNVFNTIASLPPEINTRGVRIMYCMLYREDTNMFNRHCCILYDGMVVDPTAPLWKGIKNRFICLDTILSTLTLRNSILISWIQTRVILNFIKSYWRKKLRFIML